MEAGPIASTEHELLRDVAVWARQQAEVSSDELARRLQRRAADVTAWETGEAEFSLDEFFAVMSALDVSGALLTQALLDNLMRLCPPPKR